MNINGKSSAAAVLNATMNKCRAELGQEWTAVWAYEACELLKECGASVKHTGEPSGNWVAEVVRCTGGTFTKWNMQWCATNEGDLQTYTAGCGIRYSSGNKSAAEMGCFRVK